MFPSTHAIRLAVSMIALSTSIVFSGCTPEEQKLLPIMETAISSLVENRSLTEQFVRDVKANVDPADPAYAQLMDSYQHAREVYDHYLDSLEDSRTSSVSRSLRGCTPTDVRNATADFLADATSALRPAANTRRIPFQRAVVIPDDLQNALKRLNRKTRETVVDNVNRQVRWRSWSEL